MTKLDGQLWPDTVDRGQTGRTEKSVNWQQKQGMRAEIMLERVRKRARVWQSCQAPGEEGGSEVGLGAREKERSTYIYVI